MTEEIDPCFFCGGPRPDEFIYHDGEMVPVCPGCADLLDAAMTHDYPPGDPPGRGNAPPHGNTTR